jgi:hypothetical protein
LDGNRIREKISVLIVCSAGGISMLKSSFRVESLHRSDRVTLAGRVFEAFLQATCAPGLFLSSMASAAVFSGMQGDGILHADPWSISNTITNKFQEGVCSQIILAMR